VDIARRTFFKHYPALIVIPSRESIDIGVQMKILGISGSLRKGSYNTLLLRAARQLIDKDANLEIFDISTIPFYNADIDGEVKLYPVHRLLESISGSDCLLFATPEYNHSIPGVLKNAIDWASRPAFQSVLRKKPAGILSASTSSVGGARAQEHLRGVLSSTLTPVFLTPDYLLPLANKAFDGSGMLIDETDENRLKRYLAEYCDWVLKLQKADSSIRDQ
jgi:chromate reductase, NAD(P)H dehydrogenase (quinone)